MSYACSFSLGSPGFPALLSFETCLASPCSTRHHHSSPISLLCVCVCVCVCVCFSLCSSELTVFFRDAFIFCLVVILERLLIITYSNRIVFCTDQDRNGSSTQVFYKQHAQGFEHATSLMLLPITIAGQLGYHP